MNNITSVGIFGLLGLAIILVVATNGSNSNDYTLTCHGIKISFPREIVSSNDNYSWIKKEDGLDNSKCEVNVSISAETVDERFKAQFAELGVIHGVVMIIEDPKVNGKIETEIIIDYQNKQGMYSNIIYEYDPTLEITKAYVHDNDSGAWDAFKEIDIDGVTQSVWLGPCTDQELIGPSCVSGLRYKNIFFQTGLNMETIKDYKKFRIALITYFEEWKLERVRRKE